MTTPSDHASGPRRYRHIARPSEIGAALQGLRRSLDITQAELAERARVTRKWISEMENGKATAEVGVLCRVLAALDARIEIVHAPSRRPALHDIVLGGLEAPSS
ncbi:MAG: helix-turn-helix domain-containing protein [bacterium]|nr:helix-turn-helix domain-containing protein [bacterium]